jgi:hypothetical protein
MRKDMKASDYRQHAQYCRNLAKHTLPGEFREELLEIARTWDTLAVEEREWVQQHLELALGEYQDEDALTGRGLFSSRRETRTPVRRETSKHSSPPPNP